MLERERGVIAGDPLLVVALASEGAPVHESKGGGARWFKWRAKVDS